MNENIQTKHVVTALLTLYALFAIISAYVPYMNEQRENERAEQIIDKCRVRQMFVNVDGSQSYLCESVYFENADMIIIHESESPDLKRNGYVNRPVYIFNDGTVE